MNRFVAAAAMLLLLVSCGGSGGGGATPVIPPNPTPIPQPPGPNPQTGMAGLHATTIYLLNGRFGNGNVLSYLTANLPAIKAVGFNAVYVPVIWADLDPNPLQSPRIYNQAAIAELTSVLTLVQANGMQLVSGLDYIGDGFAPNIGGVQPCAWSTTSNVYAAFEQYVGDLLTAVQAYSGVFLPMVFTEGAEGCGNQNQAAAPQVALQLQTTLGSMPTRLPPAVRALFKIGYHDYTIVAQGWGNGVGPIQLPISFNWVSMAAYNITDPNVLGTMAARFTALYPAAPFVVGEVGNSSCPAPATDASQASADVMNVQWAMTNGFGFNLWGWVPGGGVAPYDDCSNPVYGGLAITNANGSLKPAAQQVQAILKP